MSRRIHPIDDAFRSKLEHYASETPNHLWQGVARQRAMHQKVYKRWRERALMAAAMLLFIYAGFLSWRVQYLAPVHLGHFPVAFEKCDSTESNTLIANKKYSTINNNNSAFSTPSNTKLSSVIPLLPNQSQSVESLTVQLSKTIETLAEHNGTPNSLTSLSALQVLALPMALQQKRYTLLSDPSKCASFDNREGMRFFFELLASPDFAFRKIQSRGSDYESYAQNRINTEQSRYNYSVGARISAVMGNGIAIRSGVNYSSINERFEYVKENEVRVVISKRYGPNGEIIGTDTTTENYTRRLLTKNSYRTLDIPVIVGYEKQFKKLTLSANAGIYVNAHFKPNGEFLSPKDSLPVSFAEYQTEENVPIFRNKLGIGWYGSMGVSYKISPRLQLLVEPHVKMYPRSLTRDEFMTDQKYLTAGVFVGIRHQFAL
jgi:hypothetical protein